MTQLLIVDDHPLIRDGFRTVLAASFEDCDVAEAGDLAEAFDLIAREPDLDLVLLDLHLPGQEGFSALKALRAAHPALPVVMVSGECDQRLVDQAIAAGAAGFMPKSLPRDVFIAGVRTVLQGDVYAPHDLPQAQPDPLLLELGERVAKLTPQQRAVLSLVVAGRLNKEIAFDLSISETTVKAHVSAILQKLRVFSRTQAVILANRIGFVGETRPTAAHESVRAAAC